MTIKIITPEYRNIILNILNSLIIDATFNMSADPIIRVSKTRDVIVVGVNKFLSTTVGMESFIYILRCISGVWTVTGRIRKSRMLLDLDFNNDVLAISLNKSINESVAYIVMYQLVYNSFGNILTIYDPTYQPSNNKEISLFGSSLVLSGDSKLYVSDPIAKDVSSIDRGIDLIKNPGVVYEYIKIDGLYKNTRTILLTDKYKENRNHIGLGCKLELKNNDNTLCMTGFDGSVFSYILNQPKDIEHVYTEGTVKICYIDDLVEINNV